MSEINIVKENRVSILDVDDIFKLQEIFGYVQSQVIDSGQEQDGDAYQNLFLELVVPNIFINKELTQKDIDDKLSSVSATRGFVDQGKLIIARGEVVEGDNFKVLNSLKAEYESELWTENNYLFILVGYTILVALVLMMLMLFLIKYRPKIYNDNAKVTFIYFNIILMVFVTTFMVKYQLAYLFVVPLCILPLILKTFFDARLGLYVHVLTVLILGFVVPNSFEYIFLQIIAGIVTILSVSELYKRANLFISVAQITGIYILGYLAFHTIHEGNFQNIELIAIGLFILNGMITLFAQPLVYLYEKIFGLVSEVSLLELSDTNSKLLRELSNKAPGTFNHSLQVANLAEAAASEIGANAMLVRVGALYHDIGKMLNPMYFSENQISSVNPHDELEPQDSAKIIIDHVYDGIEMAKKNKLPDRLIDFIRTHHGTTQVYYFYKKALDLDENTPKESFTYPGPLPFSKETAILMMSDAVEAASKSLKNPTYEEIDQFVERIIDTQMKANQFANANITFKDIESIKKVLKKKLTNIYHLRVEYPE
jgi:putative nucleotidyltransferase with HDIG domain